jgi:hypothetical protein
MLVTCDNTGELLAVKLRRVTPANTAADHLQVLTDAVAQLPASLLVGSSSSRSWPDHPYYPAWRRATGPAQRIRSTSMPLKPRRGPTRGSIANADDGSLARDRGWPDGRRAERRNRRQPLLRQACRLPPAPQRLAETRFPDISLTVQPDPPLDHPDGSP